MAEAAHDWLVAALDRYGVPLTLLALMVVVGWRYLEKTLGELHAAYQGQIDAIRADRDHYRERSEAGEDRVRDLARDMVNELRAWRGAEGSGSRGEG